MRFPYGCIYRKNFFDKTETTDTTDTTIWKPGFILASILSVKTCIMSLGRQCLYFNFLYDSRSYQCTSPILRFAIIMYVKKIVMNSSI